MIAEFALRNEYQQEYRLSESAKTFLTAPKGFGYAMEGDYSKIGLNWTRNNVRDRQPVMSGDLFFQSADPFAEHAALIRFIRSAAQLAFVYRNSQGEFIRDVDVSEEADPEPMGTGTLRCRITMTALSLWYHASPVRLVIRSDSEGDWKKYPYKYPSRYKNFSSGAVDLINDGSVMAPVRVTWYGPVANPGIVLYVDDEEVSRCVITGEALEGETIQYSSVDGDLYVFRESAGGGRANLAAGLDLNLDNFFKIPVGASRLKVVADSAITQPVIIALYKYYRSV